METSTPTTAYQQARADFKQAMNEQVPTMDRLRVCERRRHTHPDLEAARLCLVAQLARTREAERVYQGWLERQERALRGQRAEQRPCAA